MASTSTLPSGVSVKRDFLIISLLLIYMIRCSQKDPVFDGETAYRYLVEQCEIGYRYPGSPHHKAAQQYYLDFLAPLADTLIQQPFSRKIPEEELTLQMNNIIAGFYSEGNRPLLVGAHYDTRPRADHDPDPAKRSQPILGANDGASGIAVLMHLADHLQTRAPPRTVYLVFFDGEDWGYSGSLKYYCMGSQNFAQHLPIPKPEEAIIIDMIGDRELTIPIERNSYQSHPQLVQRIWDIARKLKYPQFQHKFGGYIHDDHIMLIEYADIPAIVIIDFQYPNRLQNFWHTTADTPDKCSPASLEAVGNVLLHYIYGNY